MISPDPATIRILLAKGADVLAGSRILAAIIPATPTGGSK